VTIDTLIVDDEELARDRVRELLAGQPGFRVAGEAADGEEAVAMIESLRPDVVLLDVQMPEMDGFQVLDALEEGSAPVIVFVTAYDAFALRAFDASAVDYLLKPFYRERFAAAMQRARAQVEMRRQQGVDERLRLLLEQVRPARAYLDRLVVRSGDRIRFVRADEIRSVQADGNYLRVNAGGRTHVVRGTVGGLTARLDPGRFMRIHRSAVVAVDAVREVQVYGRGTYVLVLDDGSTLHSSAAYRAAIERLIVDAA
jgi:two-component system LytT family response regulator